MATRTSFVGNGYLQDPARAVHVVPGKEMGRVPGHDQNVVNELKRKASQRSTMYQLQPGSASMASYKQAKDYLIAMGHSSREVMDAPNTFHLRNYAHKVGIELQGALDALVETASEAERSAKLAEQRAIEMQSAAEEAAREAESASLAAREASERASSSRAEEEETSSRRTSIAAAHIAAVEREALAEASSSRAEEEETSSRSTSIAAAHIDAVEREALAEAQHEALALAESEASIESQRKAEELENESQRKAEALEQAKEAEREASLEHARAAELLAEAQAKVRSERAALVIQTQVRSLLQQRVYYKAWKSVVTLQKLHRRSILKAVYRSLTLHVAVLRAGAVFTTVGQTGKKNERFFCLSPDYRLLLWCAPSRRTKALRGEFSQPHEMPEISQLPLKNVVSISDGIRTELFKQGQREQAPTALPASPPLPKGGSLTSAFGWNFARHRFSPVRSLSFNKPRTSSNVRPRAVSGSNESHTAKQTNRTLDQLCCFSLVAQECEVNFVAPTNRIRDDWVWALQMLHAHWTTSHSLRTLVAQRKLMGVDLNLCALHRYRAVDLLGEVYVALEVEVARSSHGMGVVMDTASNLVISLESGGTGAVAGLQENDLITVVDGNAVTVIEDGYIVPRATVTAAINPAKTVLRLTVFRRYVEPPPQPPPPNHPGQRL